MITSFCYCFIRAVCSKQYIYTDACIQYMIGQRSFSMRSNISYLEFHIVAQLLISFLASIFILLLLVPEHSSLCVDSHYQTSNMEAAMHLLTEEYAVDRGFHVQPTGYDCVFWLD